MPLLAAIPSISLPSDSLLTPGSLTAYGESARLFCLATARGTPYQRADPVEISGDHRPVFRGKGPVLERAVKVFKHQLPRTRSPGGDLLSLQPHRAGHRAADVPLTNGEPGATTTKTLRPMQPMKSICLFPFLLFSIATLTLAADPAPEVDNSKAHALIDKLVIAAGGAKALKKIKTRVSEGELTSKALEHKVKVKVWQKAPNKVYIEHSIPGVMEITQGFDGKKGWEKSSLAGFREVAGAELEYLKRETNIASELRLKEVYPTMKVLPSEEVDGRKVHLIEATTKDDGVKETWYLDAETHLLTRSEQKLNLGRQGKHDLTCLVQDYEEIDGVKLPMTIQTRSPAFSTTLKLSSVKHNVELDDKLFEPPEEDEWPNLKPHRQMPASLLRITQAISF